MRNSTNSKLGSILMALLASAPAWADSMTLRWSELSPVIVNRTVSLKLADGTQIRGKAIEVEPQQLVLKVRKIGRQSIPRSQITTLDVSRPTVRWRIVGTLAGAAAGVPLGVVAAIEKDGIFSKSNGGTAIGFVVIAAVTAGGFLLGWAADRRTTTIIMASETSTGGLL
jgi:hypothetical protein